MEWKQVTVYYLTHISSNVEVIAQRWDDAVKKVPEMRSVLILLEVNYTYPWVPSSLSSTGTSE